MTVTVNIIYRGKNGSAFEFANEMISSGLVTKIREQKGNLRFDYFKSFDDPEALLLIDEWVDQEAIDIHHKSEMMPQIADLRKKYQLKMEVKQFQEITKK
ncbi:hypothetical protein HMPREF9318_00907 [Streptococcus urinalis FB127-CNA-2]|uniref:Antibiotic biosynthesis monooxygenase n=1 Tax=Streptococcus urinalis 2285-97 TaxID=764291 RepID=G5KGP1_9STRE|nr:putative quinol monooxygenase [Streptococcus urinalis]EHJ56607.1 antibiotic biosynthesis monooxygenase [Streptococcus urinalis 2285-97]EKS20953.1 hypothetical protein HMPREF9318_00907 [Streptococcus urinalis FB127-CNA-2]VEF30962.1 antibiotic biosynthesis monooxygenase [Streptococcus urinalis]